MLLITPQHLKKLLQLHGSYQIKIVSIIKQSKILGWG